MGTPYIMKIDEVKEFVGFLKAIFITMIVLTAHSQAGYLIVFICYIYTSFSYLYL